MHVLRAVFSSALLLSGVLAVAVPSVPHCQNPRALDTTYIGRNNEVLVRQIACDSVPTSQVARAIEARQSTNACSEPTTTNCFTPAGGGPDPNDCQVIAGAISFNSQGDVLGDTFMLAPSGSAAVVSMSFQSCESFIVNQLGSNLTYCLTDWASTINNLAFNCQATQNAHGGNAVANDQSFFIQVQHS
ncbi:uncharacterized protein PHACADRAFT_209491 [Phanerochaete carnosa HHB-10118-sp]|uniref:Cyanovirin-N domain-containing protein n=1 Tax=Phanerochaete carnosa (strain HHB-10118-sp) TaxID=650164 RepID=K5WZP8_PHACS|nr:uncharacterized protein PHACADRAFT_209491 [Phanerochaete carnosa HHB-10118-sp]EKM55987.1 hypothetical protein PHACADRAFT_209491 [Phanerochaete carnosa HHB-10118-sp]